MLNLLREYLVIVGVTGNDSIRRCVDVCISLLILGVWVHTVQAQVSIIPANIQVQYEGNGDRIRVNTHFIYTQIYDEPIHAISVVKEILEVINK